MNKAPRRFPAVLTDLALACLNATFLLIALCLLLYFLAARKMEEVAETFARSVAVATPLREDVAALARSLNDLHGVAVDADGASTLLPDLAQLGANVEALQMRLDAITQAPTQFLDHAIEKAATEIGGLAMTLRDCPQPEFDNAALQ